MPMTNRATKLLVGKARLIALRNRRFRAVTVSFANIFNKPIDDRAGFGFGASVMVEYDGDDPGFAVLTLYETTERTDHVKTASFSNKVYRIEPFGKGSNTGLSEGVLPKLGGWLLSGPLKKLCDISHRGLVFSTEARAIFASEVNFIQPDDLMEPGCDGSSSFGIVFGL